MTLQLLTIPNEPQNWPQWLTERFCSGELPLLVQELHLLGGTAVAEPAELDAILSPERQQEVADHGLQVLTTDELQHLFAQPDSLLQLHGYLCLCGGSIWSSLWTTAIKNVVRPTTAPTATQIWQRAEPLQLLPSAAPITVPPRSSRLRWPARLAAAITAAAVLLAVVLWPRDAAPFSLRTPAVLAADTATPQAWLDQLAEAGNRWFDQHPQNAQQLAVLIKAVSRDCELLIQTPPAILAAAPLTPKAPGDPANQAEWFVAKCRKWKGDLDATLVKLESQTIDFPAAQAEADKILMKLVTVLRAGPA